MGKDEFLAKRFEEHRTRLSTIAHRMLGSRSEADDAVQQAWLRLSRSDTAEVGNLGGWLTTVVGRVCLDMLRSRASKREEPLGEPPAEGMPDPETGREEATDPAQEALLADSVGLALLVVLETLSPAERLAFVLHDTFAVPFEEIAPVVGRSPDAARKLASRARRRVRGTATVPETDLARQREAAEAFLAAARGGDFEALLSVLDPDVVLRADYNAAAPAIVGHEVHGAQALANEALAFSHLANPNRTVRPVRVNGAVGRIVFRNADPFSVVCLTVAGGKIVAIDILADPARLRRLNPSVGGGLRPAPRTQGTRHRLVARHCCSWSVAQPRRHANAPIPGARRV